MSIEALALLLAGEVVVLWQGSRRIDRALFGFAWRPAVYPILAPGTVLHELAHAVMAVVLRVRVRRFVPFRPTRAADGRLWLGWVEHDRPDPVRGALIALAPAVLVPPLLLLATAALTDGTFDYHELLSGGPWRILLWLVVVGLGSLATFPSDGDRVPLPGLAVLLAAGAGLAALASSVGFLGPLLVAAVVSLAVPAAVQAVLLVALALR